MQWMDLLWTTPAIFGIIISLFFLYRLNRKKRRNLIKMSFSAYLFLLIIFDILSIIRHLTTNVGFSLIISRMVLTFALFSTTLFMITSILMYDRKKANLALLLFIPSSILSLFFWNPSAVYYSGVDVRYGYGMESLIFSLYMMYQSIAYILVFIFFFLTYFKYKMERFGYKIRYFIIAAIICSLSMVFNRIVFGYGTLPLIQQTINPSIAVAIIMYGYIKR